MRSNKAAHRKNTSLIAATQIRNVRQIIINVTKKPALLPNIEMHVND